MIIDYFKHQDLWLSLAEHNQYLLSVGKTYKYHFKYDTTKKEASPWLDPANVKRIPCPKKYPEVNEDIFNDTRFNLAIHTSYYLPIFLCNLLYKSKQDILIEDAGGGDGKWFYYLNKLGFYNFHIIDNFSHLPKQLLDDNMKQDNINYLLNDLSLLPTVVNNVGCYGIFPHIAPRITRSMELLTCYSHEKFDCIEFYNEMEKLGFKFLCRDFANIAIAFCRIDKYDEFITKLKPYNIGIW